ncbi:membrane progestin receptor gamma-B [Corythoichthys intestinalis]|uniref:membrane progestin receptor gamma-B n=1 Tax=Corythoichthys intestinalis TaxID=161448 RepID=UPI0025A4E136|nr:membrane progestin receptor gamma-B [Corythoichthys intestinalis]XP_061811306.1 membrane progestin receptor gamma-B-like [Nerophis lumbriciformis]
MFSLMKLPRVVTINQVPKEFHEDSIISGYRHPRSSATDCILSLFQLTNETLNIWTHFLPTWYFLWKLVSVVLMQTVWQHPFTWPLVVLIVSSCIYPLASSCAHTFNSMSPRARHMCFYFDYGALSLYSMGSAIAYSAYVFPDKWVNNILHQSFIPVALLNSVICTSLACYSRLGLPILHHNHDLVKRFPECRSPRFRKALRIVAFAFPYLFDSIPLLYRVFLCEGEGCTDNDANVFHKTHIGLAFLTGFLFATHLPERLAPGSFDYIGNSHQLFHVFGVLGTHIQIMAIERDMTLRRSLLLDHSLAITFGNSVGVTLLCLLLNLTIVLLFSLPLLSTRIDQQKKQNSSAKAM